MTMTGSDNLAPDLASSALPSDWVEVERHVSAFESARRSGPARISAFLPPEGSRLRGSVLLELLRVDLELSIARGEPRQIDDYRADHPELLNDRRALALLAFEEWRCRAACGQAADPAEYARAYGIDTSSWRSEVECPDPAGFSFDLSIREVPSVAEIAAAFDDFRIVRTLGEGSFARVVLATQPQLADRPIVLKVSYHLHHEAEKLARLQHTNIVPVYATHLRRGMQAVVMPYHGDITLAHALRDRARPYTTGDAFDLVARLADGLAHAHARGVLHLDLKPANILLADGGEPMLLDFNLSGDVHQPGGPLGGSLAYLEPDLLAPGQARAPDARTDVYALGMILLEMLHGRYPWSGHPQNRAERLDRLLAERQDIHGVIRALPPAVTPAARSVVSRCLHPDRSHRYAAVAEVAEDLRRHCADLPLRHAPDRSPVERAGKFVRRNRWMVSMGAVSALAAAIVLVGSLAFVARGRQLARADARGAIAEFDRGRAEPRLVLSAPVPRPGEVQQAIQKAEALLQRLGAWAPSDTPAWAHAADPAESDRVRLAAAELAMLVARGHRIVASADAAAGSAPSRSAFDPALAANARAEALLGEQTQAVRLQRAAIFASAGDPAGAAALVGTGTDPEPASAREHYLAGIEAAGQHDIATALRHLGRAVELDPGDPAPWFLLARCRGEAGDPQAARRAAEVAAALDPGSARLLHEVGRWAMECDDLPAAGRAYDRAIETDASFGPSYLDRAVVRMRLNDTDRALSDLREALALEPSVTRAYFMQARLLSARGDTAGAAESRAAGMRREPGDEQSYVARGVARLPADPVGAIADFDLALRLNPRSLDALQNKAHVLSEHLGRDAEALRVMEAIVGFRPADAETRSAIGVLRARLGSPEALADAKAALALPAVSSVARYQAACVHALLVPAGHGSADRAMTLLAEALAGGFGFEEIEADRDLSSLRADPRFAVLLEFARLRRGGH